jgi:hypothetical protein
MLTTFSVLATIAPRRPCCQQGLVSGNIECDSWSSQFARWKGVYEGDHGHQAQQKHTLSQKVITCELYVLLINAIKIYFRITVYYI